MPALRVDISTAVVRELLASQFPAWADLRIERVEPGGNDHQTFRLGSDMSVRLPVHERYAAQVDKEQKWLPVLAPLLPLPIPVPLAVGKPSDAYPWRWSVCRWLAGEDASTARIDDLAALARALARFLGTLHQIDPADGPPPGPHNFFRGGPLTVYDRETRKAIATLRSEIDAEGAATVWDAALKAAWHRSPVWLHGDVSASNLLVRGGRLSAVIDFGCLGVGDPACDLTIVWTLFAGRSRDVFRTHQPLDAATWARARGWALWKGLLTLADDLAPNSTERLTARRVVDEVIAEHAAAP